MMKKNVNSTALAVLLTAALALSLVFAVGCKENAPEEYSFEDLGGRTRVTQLSTIKARGPLKIMFFLFGWLMKKSGCDALDRELANLKRLMEDK